MSRSVESGDTGGRIEFDPLAIANPPFSHQLEARTCLSAWVIVVIPAIASEIADRSGRIFTARPASHLLGLSLTSTGIWGTLDADKIKRPDRPGIMPQFKLTKIIMATVPLTMAPWGMAAAQSGPEAIVEGWIAASKPIEFLSVSHGGIVHEQSSNTTTISNLSIRLEVDGAKMQAQAGSTTAKATGKLDYTITFPAISFADLALDNGYYSASRINADIANLNFEIVGDAKNSSSAKGAYEKLVINNVKWAQPPAVANAPDKPVSKFYPLVAALVDISFDDASLDGMTMNQSTGDPAVNMILRYGATRLGQTVRGNISQMTLDGLAMNMSVPKGGGASQPLENFQFTAGQMSVNGYDYRTFIESFAPGSVAATDNDAYNPVIGELSFADFGFNAPDGQFSIDRIFMKDFGVRRPRIDVLSAVDKMVVAQMAGGAEPDPREVIELVASIYGAFRLGEFEIADIRVNAPDAQGVLGSYRIADLSANGLGEISLSGVNFAGKRGEFVKLERISVNDIGFPPLEALMNLEAAQENNDVLAIMKAMPTLGSYRAKGIDVRIPNEGEISLEDSQMVMADHIGPIPTKLDIRVNKVNMPVKYLEREQRAPLEAMGYANIEVSYGLQAAWDEASGTLSLASDAALTDGGTLDAAVTIGGVPRSVFENPMTAQNAIALLTINRANVEFDDQSIVSRGLKLAAAQQKSDPETLKAQMVGMLPFVLQALQNPSFVNELSAAVKLLLDKGGKITASATPANPVSLMQVVGVSQTAPGALIDLMNVKVVAQP